MKTIYTHSGLGHIDELIAISLLYEKGDKIVKIKGVDKITPNKGDIFVDIPIPSGVDGDGIIELDHHSGNTNDGECSFIKVLQYMGKWDDILWQDETIKLASYSDCGLDVNGKRYSYGLLELGLVKSWWTSLQGEVVIDDKVEMILAMVKDVFLGYVDSKINELKEKKKIKQSAKIWDDGDIVVFDKPINVAMYVSEYPRARYFVLPNNQNISQTSIVALNGRGGNPDEVYLKYYANRKIVFKHKAGFLIVIE